MGQDGQENDRRFENIKPSMFMLPSGAKVNEERFAKALSDNFPEPIKIILFRIKLILSK